MLFRSHTSVILCDEVPLPNADAKPTESTTKYTGIPPLGILLQLQNEVTKIKRDNKTAILFITQYKAEK